MEEHKLLAVFDNPEDMHLPPILHSHLLDIKGGLQQESCAFTAAADQETLTNSHALSNILMQCHGQMWDVKLDLSLGDGDGDYHTSKEYILASASSEHSASIETDLDDQSNNGDVAATSHPLNASGCVCNPSDEKGLENMPGSSSPSHRFTSSFAFSRKTLPADGPFTSPLHDDKVFFCKFCDRQFHSSQALGGHQNAHKRERLVARSTSSLALPPFFCSAPRPFASPPMSNMLPSCITGDRSKSFPCTVAVNHHEERTHSPMLVPRMCKNRFKDPYHVSTMHKTSFNCNCMRGNNVYIIGNRSLGIKAHSLVHKPAVAQALHDTPLIGHMRGLGGWPRVEIDGRAGISRGFVPGHDHSQHGSMQTTTRFATSSLCAASKFVCHLEAPPCSLLHPRQHHTPTPSVYDSKSHITRFDISPLPCSELDSCASGHVDLALHL